MNKLIEKNTMKKEEGRKKVWKTHKRMKTERESLKKENGQKESVKKERKERHER